MSTKLMLCTLHKIAYNTDLDPVCPQCVIARIEPFKSIDFDSASQKPLDAQGKPLELAVVVPAKF